MLIALGQSKSHGHTELQVGREVQSSRVSERSWSPDIGEVLSCLCTWDDAGHIVVTQVIQMTMQCNGIQALEKI